MAPDRGGSIASADGRLRVEVPAGAVAEPVRIAVTALEPGAVAAGAVPSSVGYRLEPPALRLLLPATVTYRLEKDEIAAALDGVAPPFADAVAGDSWEPLVWLTVTNADGSVEIPGDQALVRAAGGSTQDLTASVTTFGSLWTSTATGAASEPVHVAMALLHGVAGGSTQLSAFAIHNPLGEPLEVSVTAIEAAAPLSASAPQAASVPAAGSGTIDASLSCSSEGMGVARADLGMAGARSGVRPRTTGQLRAVAAQPVSL